MNVGDYVRTKYGISKIISNPNENAFNIDIYKKDRITLRCIKQKDVIKSSPNIIDLIEAGDYVNGYIVKDILDNGPNGLVVQTAIDFLYEREIKSIVTKQQFSQMEYKIQ